MSERDDDLEMQALNAVDVPTQPVDAVDAPTEALSVADQPTPHASGSITELISGPFGAGSAGGAAAAPVEGEAAIESRRSRARAEAPRRPGILVIVAGALAAVLVLIGLFVLGTRISEWTAEPSAEPTPEPTLVTPSPAPTPTPTPIARPTAPASPGVHEWTALFGGECFSEYLDPWQLEFTVVDCAEPHPAQLTFRGPLSTDPAAEYPGEEAIASQVPVICGAPTGLDLATAGAYADLQVQAAYPVSAEAWEAGERDYFCFVTRSSGEPLTGSVAPTG
ncbi:hypothetical protein GCM10009792_23850 [Microcella alkalica]|uniref:Septum formation-related domain-containing protein n=1 Tax=Microcella alkalica TaxID=355930 RepID=A0A839E701_9MICO|nr:septum formation family protein [Microcella alkalica]MBA8848439.1 hypothetical protein [Microcella alkalica]